MTTGQHPRRRETDAQAERRVEQLEERRLEYEQLVARINPPLIWKRPAEKRAA